MANLYNGKMAAIYDAMYQNFIDYDEEFNFYNNLIQDYHGKTVLEIGSGSGNLSKRFLAHNTTYIGLDYSESMIAIAQERNKKGIFLHGDMRDFKLEQPVDSILITGRSTSYLITNEDLNNTFQSIYKNLNEEGTLIFDFIDANRFIPFTKDDEAILHEAPFEDLIYF